MRLPDVVARMRELADAHDIGELHRLADEVGRRRPERRAPVRSQRMSPTLADEIRRFAAANPGLSQAEIGRHFNVNPGRVSECVWGKRL